MIGFHIDMNVAQFTPQYLEKWLNELARLGYDTVIWEVENNVKWETCPECASPDAFTKDEFREILALCRNLGLEPIPLFQTIAHCEYVLKHEKYKHLAESPGAINQYCPTNPDLMEFLDRWIDEYLELFGKVAHFHLGADEAWSLGSCGRCAQYAKALSLSDLYVNHVNALAEKLAQLGVTPAIWADMVLHHNEALDKLSRDIMLFDWMYDIRYGMGRFWVWGKGWVQDDAIPRDVLDKFGDYLFPEGDEPGKAPEAFYTADFLAAQGLSVVTCPASSSYGDNVFAPRNWYHMANTFDSCHKGLSPTLAGSVLTSWTVHLHPWELQAATISIPPYVVEHPSASLEHFQNSFARSRFGADDRDFWVACGLLSKKCLFTYTDSLGYDKSAQRVAPGHVARVTDRIRAEGGIDRELENSRARLDEYRKALALFEAIGEAASAGESILEAWVLAARNLVNRAEASVALLSHARGEQTRVDHILEALRALRVETDRFYSGIIKPTRRREMMDWMYSSIEEALAELASK